MTTLFAEHGHRAVASFAPDRPPRTVAGSWRGMCRETITAERVDHVFADDDALLDGTACDRDVAAALREVLCTETAPPCPPDLGGLATEHGVEVTWADYRQRVLVGTPDEVRGDLRAIASVEIRKRTAPEQVCTVALPAAAGDGALRAAIAEIAGFAALPAGTLPRGRVDVVLEPGRAGAFFHELLGHPLEADVLASGTSYLSGRFGERVAPPWLDVWDGAAADGEGIGGSLDDEGTPVRSAPLLSGGVVAGALCDRASSAPAGLVSTGHGRRLDYRHPVIPRMRHTVAAVTAGGEEPGVPHLLPRGLALRHMNLRTGDFEFLITAAVLADGDRPARVGPLTLSGNARRVLAALRPGRPEVASVSAKANKGCGKLGQFPVVVTFANAGVWIPGAAVEVRDERG